MNAAHYKINSLDETQFQFRLIAKNGKTILTSNIHSNISDTLAEIEKLIHHGSDMRNFNFLYTKDFEMYFTITNSTELIAKSNVYKTKQGLFNGCNSVMDNCNTTTISYKNINE